MKLDKDKMEPRRSVIRDTCDVFAIADLDEVVQRTQEKPRGLYPISEVLDELGFGVDTPSGHLKNHNHQSLGQYDVNRGKD